MNSRNSKRVLITGGTRGLGLAICRQLLLEGWQVLTGARHFTPELRALTTAFPDQLSYFKVDLSQPEQARRLANEAGLLEGVEAFIANAALGSEGLLTLTSEAVLRETVELNLIAPMLLAREAIKGMLSRGGNLVFISSVSARTGLAGLSVYSATKAALIGFSRALAREYGSRGIRSNCIVPGLLETDMTSSIPADQRVRIQNRTALKRLGQPQDVVGAVSFLLSDAARYITGTELVVDGGFSA